MWLCTGGPAEPEERVGAGAAVPLLPVLLSGLPPAGQTAPVQHLRHQVPHVQHAGAPPLPPRCRRLVHIFPDPGADKNLFRIRIQIKTIGIRIQAKKRFSTSTRAL